MMSYREWFKKQGEDHRKIVDKLVDKGLSKAEIIEYFDFDNMVAKENDFCPLYKDNKKCHDMESLNCFLCACPYFRFHNTGIKKISNKTQYSYCSIESKNGQQGVYGDAIHQDCSNCTVPHKKRFVSKNYNEDWFVPMKDCDIT
jgi:hypothetical protein